MAPPSSVLGIAAQVRQGTLSAESFARAALARIATANPELGAFLAITETTALEQAQAVDRSIAKGVDPGPLAGVPIGLKDALCTQGIPTTAGSKILQGWLPPYDATVTERLRGAGAVLVGKLNMDEFAMGSSNENSAYGPCRNPWDLLRVPGGSSGGSAAAVAADLCAGSLGSDTGGSIRQPASFCGVVGLKPTYGRVSRYGLVAFASSLDQVGPFARSVRDCAAIFGVIAGHDPKDATSLPVPVPDYVAACERPVTGLRIGLPQEYFQAGIAPQVEARVREALAVYERLGATIVPVALPHTPHAIATYYLLATAEASSNLARFDGVRYGQRVLPPGGSLDDLYRETRGAGFGREVKRRIMLGTYCLRSGHYDAYYRKAQQVRALIARDFDAAFAQVDVLATPTSPTTAFAFGERTTDPLSMYLADVYTISANLAGIPAMSLPCGFDDAGLPVGLQLLGRCLGEETLFAAATAYQDATDFHTRSPHKARS